MEFLPVFLNIKGRKCVVVGGGDIATRKAGMLVEAGGIVDIITGHKAEKFSEFGHHEQIT